MMVCWAISELNPSWQDSFQIWSEKKFLLVWKFSSSIPLVWFHCKCVTLGLSSLETPFMAQGLKGASLGWGWGFREQENDVIGTTVHGDIVGTRTGNKVTMFSIYNLCYINIPFVSKVNKKNKHTLMKVWWKTSFDIIVMHAERFLQEGDAWGKGILAVWHSARVSPISSAD